MIIEGLMKVQMACTKIIETEVKMEIVFERREF